MYKEYKRKGTTEMRPVNEKDIEIYQAFGKLLISGFEGKSERLQLVSISDEDIDNGSPKLGDMIARNKNNHNDQWLIAEKYFKENYVLDK